MLLGNIWIRCSLNAFGRLSKRILISSLVPSRSVTPGGFHSDRILSLCKPGSEVVSPEISYAPFIVVQVTGVDLVVVVIILEESFCTRTLYNNNVGMMSDINV